MTHPMLLLSFFSGPFPLEWKQEISRSTLNSVCSHEVAMIGDRCERGSHCIETNKFDIYSFYKFTYAIVYGCIQLLGTSPPGSFFLGTSHVISLIRTSYIYYPLSFPDITRIYDFHQEKLRKKTWKLVLRLSLLIDIHHSILGRRYSDHALFLNVCLFPEMSDESNKIRCFPITVHFSLKVSFDIRKYRRIDRIVSD